MNDYTQRQLESELSKLVIDLVWSATDGGCKLKESDFSYFEEPLYEWTELVNKFSTSIAQAEQETTERIMQYLWEQIQVMKISLLDKEIINPNKE